MSIFDVTNSSPEWRNLRVSSDPLPVSGFSASPGSGPGYSLGIDLGATFVAAAIADKGRPEMIGLGQRSVLMPAAVFLDREDRLLLGEAALRCSVNDPDRAALGFIRHLGDPTPVSMAGQTRTTSHLLVALLREVLRMVTETQGGPPERVAFTHPATWGPRLRRLFGEVAHLAGLDHIITLTEPVAAATHYAASRRITMSQTVAVYDIGGGTLDVTVLRGRPDRLEVLGLPERVERLGGLDFDRALFAHLDRKSDGALNSLDIRDPSVAVALARVRQDCVLAKEHLSVDRKMVIPVFLPERSFDVTVTRSEFETLIRASLQCTVQAIERVLASARIDPADLDAVLLVGGSSRIPLVAEMLTDALKRPIVSDPYPQYAVALGAAIAAATVDHAISSTPTGTNAPGSARVGDRVRSAGWVAGRMRVRRVSVAAVLTMVVVTGLALAGVATAVALTAADRPPTGAARTLIAPGASTPPTASVAVSNVTAPPTHELAGTERPRLPRGTSQSGVKGRGAEGRAKAAEVGPRVE